jgi:hypothetical protein
VNNGGSDMGDNGNCCSGKADSSNKCCSNC